jgi:putative restriction endonuclease
MSNALNDRRTLIIKWKAADNDRIPFRLFRKSRKAQRHVIGGKRSKFEAMCNVVVRGATVVLDYREHDAPGIDSGETRIEFDDETRTTPQRIGWRDKDTANFQYDVADFEITLDESETHIASVRKLGQEHLEALEWFSSREGQRIGWPDQLPSGLFLANKAKGIHKPKDWDHALSIRVMLSSDYEDGDIEFDADGRWHFRYHQEGDASEAPEAEFANRALLRNRDDGVPVGIMRQISGKPNVLYHVLGIGRVIGYSDGFFHIVGPVEIDDPLPIPDVVEHFDPSDIEDARRFTLAVIHRRQGQQRFRQSLLAAYDGKCAISGCDVEALLDAAHLVPYRGPETNKVRNGILLRTDLHTLFDLNLMSIDPDTFTVSVARSITQPEYASLSGLTMRLPRDAALRPSKEAIQWRLDSHRTRLEEQ